MDILPEITQHLIDILREKTGTDYVFAETRVDSLPGDEVISAIEEAVEHFAGRSERPAMVADLADVVAASIRMTTLVDG